MNFGEILEKWEKQSPHNAAYDKDKALTELSHLHNNEIESLAGRRSRLIRKKPDAFLDLHGLNCDEAWKAMQIFFEDSSWKKLEKVLVIHGKGNHHTSSVQSQTGEATLRDLTRRFIETCSFAGESGFTHSREGGRGATWVILKQRN